MVCGENLLVLLDCLQMRFFDFLTILKQDKKR